MSLEWAVIGIPGFAAVLYLLHRARAIGERVKRQAWRERIDMRNRERGER